MKVAFLTRGAPPPKARARGWAGRIRGRCGGDQARSTRNARAAAARYAGSSTPHSSRAECMDSTGIPTSTVRIPSRVAMIGPTVLPHGMVFFETNSCDGTAAFRQARAQAAAPGASR